MDFLSMNHRYAQLRELWCLYRHLPVNTCLDPDHWPTKYESVVPLNFDKDDVEQA